MFKLFNNMSYQLWRIYTNNILFVLWIGTQSIIILLNLTHIVTTNTFITYLPTIFYICFFAFAAILIIIISLVKLLIKNIKIQAICKKLKKEILKKHPSITAKDLNRLCSFTKRDCDGICIVDGKIKRQNKL